MDTVFKIKNKDEEIYYGANHFGYRFTMLKGAYLLFKKYNKIELTKAEEKFISDNLYKIDGTNVEDIEAFIDLNEKYAYLDFLAPKEPKKLSFSELENLYKLEIKVSNN